MTDARIVLTTVSSKDAADKLATELVERRLAACVNIIGPIHSVYRWRNEVRNEAEYLLLIKTTAHHASHLESAFKELHPYELPECVQLSIDQGNEDYLAWLAAEVGNAS